MTYQENYAKVLDQNNNSNMSSPFFLNVTYFKQDNNELLADVFEPLENISVNNFKPIEMRLSIYTLNSLLLCCECEIEKQFPNRKKYHTLC